MKKWGNEKVPAPLCLVGDASEEVNALGTGSDLEGSGQRPLGVEYIRVHTRMNKLNLSGCGSYRAVNKL